MDQTPSSNGGAREALINAKPEFANVFKYLVFILIAQFPPRYDLRVAKQFLCHVDTEFIEASAGTRRCCTSLSSSSRSSWA